MIGKGYEVVNDLYDIAKRIKEIDEQYFTFYSYEKKRYEVHHRGQIGNTLALVVPYDKLDGRTLVLVQKSRRERMDEFLRETKKENEILRKKNVWQTVKEVEKATERVFSSLP